MTRASSACAERLDLTGFRAVLPALRPAWAEIKAEHAKRRALKRRLAAVRGRVRRLVDAV
ncbi:MAG: hypothetical protein RBR34_07670 [Rhodospirillaceae bacterium]|nr:hypothetical protein [Rhodospirillaceae bacterium]